MSSASHSCIESQPKEARPDFSWVSYETKRGSTFWETLWPHECLTEPQKVAPFLNCLGCSSCTLPLFPPSLNPKPYSAERFVASVWDDYHALFLFAPSLPRPSLPSLSRSLALSLSCSPALSLSCALAPLFVSASHHWRRHGGRRSIRGGGAGQEGYLLLQRQHLPSQQGLVCVVALRTGRSAGGGKLLLKRAQLLLQRAPLCCRRLLRVLTNQQSPTTYEPPTVRICMCVRVCICDSICIRICLDHIMKLIIII